MPDDLNLVNKLYYGDNLIIMREFIPDECVDLIYLDPPFNSKATYNVLFHEKDGSDSPAQITAFEDTWHWDMAAAATYEELVKNGPAKLSDLVQALRSFLGTNDMMAYLTMMAVRLVEMRRVLKSTGSIYLHCDPTASHYLKLLLDAVFGPANFRNEIIWRNTNANNNAKRFGTIHQTIFYYAKSDNALFRLQREPYLKSYIESSFRHKDARGLYRAGDLTGPGVRTGDSGKPWGGYEPTKAGRHWQPASYIYDKYRELTDDDLSKYPFLERLDKLDENDLIHWNKAHNYPWYKSYLDDKPGTQLQDLWAFIPGTKGCLYGSDMEIGVDVKWLMVGERERLGYPTQKPEGLLERIIESSCPEDGLVMDPFCGCGTTIAVAERLQRRWIGIDVTHLAITLMERRLKDAFGEQLALYQVIGDPKDLESARALSHSNRHQFEWWALSLVEARPAQDKKKGADTGIDGYINFFDDDSGKAKKIVVQVKSGHVSVHQVRDLCHVVDREKATIGVFVTLENPTGPMKKEAAGFGFYTPEHYPDRKYPRMQLLTIEDLLGGAEVQYPKTLAPQATFKKAATKKKAPKSKDKSHPEAMFDEGLLEDEPS